MSIFCSQTDCLLHPDYVNRETRSEKSQPTVDSNSVTYSPVGWGSVTTNSITWSSAFDMTNNMGIATRAFEVPTDESKSVLIIKLGKDFEVPIECLFCEYLKRIDMKKEVWAMRAQTKLLEK